MQVLAEEEEDEEEEEKKAKNIPPSNVYLVESFSTYSSCHVSICS